MRDVIEFPVVGSKYLHKAIESIQELQVGDLLELVSEPTNIYDANAIAVFNNGTKLGYVPNKGVTCTNCWSGVPSRSNVCPKCSSGSDAWITGGLATRLKFSGYLSNNFICFVKKLDFSTEYILTAELSNLDLL